MFGHDSNAGGSVAIADVEIDGATAAVIVRVEQDLHY